MMRQFITMLLIGLFAQSSVAQVMGNGFTPFLKGRAVRVLRSSLKEQRR